MAHTPKLFTPLQIKKIHFKNRIWVSPMCQYSSENGSPTDWHLVHLGSRAVGGAGLVMVEATAVSPEGRISPADSGIWSDEHVLQFSRITNFIKGTGAVVGIQLAHAGRKASTAPPWENRDGLAKGDPRGWTPLSPTARKFKDSYPEPRAMNKSDIEGAVRDFVNAAQRSLKAGFDVLELHMAHGYLMNQFLSPLSNDRTDEFGGSLENRMRFPLMVASAVRKVWPNDLPLFVRISATDWAEDRGWDLSDSIVLCKELKKIGVDLIDCSSGGSLPEAQIPVGPAYQVHFADVIRGECDMMTAAVGLITNAIQAESILHQGQADAIFMAREFLRDPYFPVRAAKELKFEIDRPKQYGRS